MTMEAQDWPSFDEVLDAARRATEPAPIGSTLLPEPLPPTRIHDIDLDNLLSPGGLSEEDRAALGTALEPLPAPDLAFDDPVATATLETADAADLTADDTEQWDTDWLTAEPEFTDGIELDSSEEPRVSNDDIDREAAFELPVAADLLASEEPDVEELAPVFELSPTDFSEPETSEPTNQLENLDELDWSTVDWASEGSDDLDSTSWATAEPDLSTFDLPETGPTTEPLSTPTGMGFDSIATADAIEDDLQDLFDFADDDADLGGWQIDEADIEADFPDEAGSPDNVVQIHDVEPTDDDVFGLDAPTPEAPAATRWVSVGLEDEQADPWAHMRPDEYSEVRSGFWANRPRFFGGDERRRRKAERKALADQVEARKDYTPVCPSCGENGRVDLDDPVGAKVHASCAACDHVWTEAYEVERKSA